MMTKRAMFVVNPYGGKRHGLAILEEVKPIFSAAGFEPDVRVTKYPGHAREIAKTFPIDLYGSLCAIGGDGTVHDILSGLMARKETASIPLGIIPAGTGNDVAKQLGINSILESAQRIVAGRTEAFDIMRVTWGDQIDYCITLIGWAGAADINCKAERLRIFGPARYAIAALVQILVPKRRHAKLILDGQCIEDDFLLVVACNTIYSGSGMQLAPRARVDDGKIDVVILRKASKWQMFRLLTKVFDGSHIDMPGVEYHQVRSLCILSDDHDPLDLDGEIKGTTPVSIQAIPKAVRLFVKRGQEPKCSIDACLF
ncbi:MAG: diacylglycerol kinase family lipid kinase [Pirellulales bacterium]|nr:diacylglycerol kinase family lipid kinase [Pirellulales bacterium]